MSKSPPVQALYQLCKTTFTSSTAQPPLASSQAIQKLRSLLDTIGPADVGLKEDNVEDDRGHGFFGLNQFNRVARWAQPIMFLDIYECDSFTARVLGEAIVHHAWDTKKKTTHQSKRFKAHNHKNGLLEKKMCIFCLPTSSTIPLHDHPGMTVLSKVLYGSMHVKAYDWVEPACIQRINGFPVRLAKLTVDRVVTAPCQASALYPKSGGNLHCFTAVTPCAVLDILAPPYLEAAGRKCTYYHDYPYSSFSTGNGTEIRDGTEEDQVWLKEIDTPDNLYMRSREYTGPAIRV